MKRVKRRLFSGAVCEQIVYNAPDRADVKKSAPRLRFKSEEEREQHRLGISRRNHARLVNENFSPTSLYSTLTFDDEHEVHTFEEAKRIRTLYVRRLKYACPDAVIFIYLGRGKSTNRIHSHMLSEGVPEEIIRKQWIYGKIVSCDHLRAHNFYNGVDRGQDYTSLANYLFNHWTPEQGGHRWKQTTNARKPSAETPKEIKREYTADKPPRPPKGYMLVETISTPYGYLYFKYVREPEKRRRKSEKMRC